MLCFYVQVCRRSCTQYSRRIRGGSARPTVSSRPSWRKWRHLPPFWPSPRSRWSATWRSATLCARRQLPVYRGQCVSWSSSGWQPASRPFRTRYTLAPTTTFSIRPQDDLWSTRSSAPFPRSGCRTWDTPFRYKLGYLSRLCNRQSHPDKTEFKLCSGVVCWKNGRGKKLLFSRRQRRIS